MAAAAAATAASATMEGIGADVTHGGLHRVRLARTIAAATALAPASAATAAARLLHETLVIGLLQRVGDRTVVLVVVVVLVERPLRLRRAQRAFVVGLLQRVGDRT